MTAESLNPLRAAYRIICAFLLFAWPYSQMNAWATDLPTLERDIAYGTANGIDLKLDLCRPSTGMGPFPALIYLHGLGGTKAGCASVLREAASRGYVAVAPNWFQNQFPEPVYEVKCAVRWLRANARKLNIDSDRIGAVGFSAGGHLALMLALTDKSDGLEGDYGDMPYSSRIQAAVSSAGNSDLVSLYSVASAGLTALLGGPPDKFPDRYAKASPLTYVTRDDPPILLLHGDRDTVVPLQQDQLLDAKLTEVGVPHTVLIKMGRAHEPLWDEKEAWEFLADYLHP